MQKKIFLIAGEPSGDRLGAGLMRALPDTLPYPVEMHGIGGQAMMEEGLASLFPMTDIALMGFAEIVPHIPTLLKRIRQTVEAIERLQPDAVITIDSPGFCFRVVKQLRARGKVRETRFIHYVAPSVWAYKPERAKKVAALFDMLLVLFPFEPEWFEREGLNTVFVGHPVMDTPSPEPHPKPGHLVMLPGSRKGELARHLPLYRQTLALLKQESADLTVTLPVPAHWEKEVRARTADWPVPVTVVSGEEAKQAAFASAMAALVKSGTVTLEVAKAGVPMVTTYKVNPLSAWIVKRMIQTKFVNLVNILLNREAVPELLQERATATELASHLQGVLQDASARNAQKAAFTEALRRLAAHPPATASQLAAKAVVEML